MKLRYFFLTLILSASIAMAQKNAPTRISVEARGDYQNMAIRDTQIKSENGFRGNIINFILNGDISPKFSYAYRQRLSGINKSTSFFDATDWIKLTYKANKNFSITGGKQVVYVGGFEFDTAPIDCFFLSEFPYHFACYQWGANVGYQFSHSDDLLMAQVCQSPFRGIYQSMSREQADMYAYNLIWYGHHRLFHSIWSFNLLEYAPGRFINYISLGNKFNIGKHLVLDLDLMHRADIHDIELGTDFSIVSQLSYMPIEPLKLFAKASYDYNESNTADYCVLPGTGIKRIGIGFEYLPLKNNDIRIHGYYSYGMGTNANLAGFVKDDMSVLNFGLTWRIKVL